MASRGGSAHGMPRGAFQNKPTGFSATSTTPIETAGAGDAAQDNTPQPAPSAPQGFKTKPAGSILENLTAAAAANPGQGGEKRNSAFNQGGGGFRGTGANAAGIGGGDGGQRSSGCFNCGKEGHRKDECPEPQREKRDPMKCYNCNKEGHRKDECPEPPRERREPGKCFNCNKEGHRRDECPEPQREKREPGKCYNCDQPGHRSSECTAPKREKTSGPRADGKSGPERPKYVPTPRNVDDIFGEDDAVKKLYSTIFEDDEQIIITGAGSDVSVMTEWTQLPLNPVVLKNIERAGYLHPRKIQSHSIPLIWEGRDLKAQAETGSGKSAAFLIPLIHKVIEDKKTAVIKPPKNKPFALIMEPTRELALQVYEQARKLAHTTGVQVVKCYGQYDATKNGEEILRGCDIVVGTPGRLQHFVLDSVIDSCNLKYFVLDECDRLLEADDFMDIVRKIRGISTFPKSIQTLLFSATFTKAIDGLAKEFLKDDHAYIHNKNIVAANGKVAQSVIKCASNEKKQKVLELLQADLKDAQAKDPTATQPPTLVFVRTRSDADLMALYLCECECRATTINGDRPQSEREVALEAFRSKKTPILVATDVCARGLDVKNLDYVINMDLPDDIVTYVHRIGRTGRLKPGKATSLFDPASESDLKLSKGLVDTLKQSSTDVPEFLVEAAKNAPAPPLTGAAFGLNSAGPKPFGAAGGAAGGGFTKPPGFASKPTGSTVPSLAGGPPGFSKPFGFPKA